VGFVGQHIDEIGGHAGAPFTDGACGAMGPGHKARDDMGGCGE
jgi:hypothetical protein